MKPPASFTTLPVELVANICTHADLKKDDLCALRLTAKSQGVHGYATEEFARRYFTSVSILYTHYSLQAFVDICKHPVFGPSVRRVELSCARVRVENFNKEVEWLRYGNPKDGFRQRLQKFSRDIPLLVNRCDFESFESEEAQRLLELAFHALASLDHTLTLAISSEESRSIGHTKTYGPADTESISWLLETHDTLEILIRAAEKSGCTVHKLGYNVNGSLDLGMRGESGFPVTVAQISELSLDLSLLNNYFADEHVKPIVDLLSCATNLKSLRIHTPLFNDDGFDKVIASFASLPLEKLCLINIELNSNTFSNALNGMGRTLRHLEINRCNIYGFWNEILEFIHGKLNQLNYLSVTRWDTSSWMGCNFEYSGVENVQSGVEELLQKRLAQIMEEGSASE